VRITAACGLALTLAACTSPQREVEQAALRQNTEDCLVRESVAVVPQSIDLDTAALAVLARCDYPGVLERSITAEYPGYREYIHELVQKRYAEILDTTKRGIAMLRTKGASQAGATH
jgi:hypothetical protein